MSSLVYLLVWSPPPHIPYISSPNQCLLFATHVHTIAACFALVPRLYHLFSQLLTWNSMFYLNITDPSDHSYLCSLKCHLVFFPDRPFHVAYYFSHNCSTASLSESMIYPYIGKLWYQLPEKSSIIFNTCSYKTTTRNVGQCPTWWPPCRI